MKKLINSIVLITVYFLVYYNQQALAQNNIRNELIRSAFNQKGEIGFKIDNYCNLENSPQFNISMTPQVLFYGNSAGTYTLSDGGYIAGTNSYKDRGKYQRFDYTGSANLIEVRIYFSRKTKTGTADNFNLVIKEVGTSGAPGNTLYTKTYTTDVIDISQPGVVYNTFTINPTINVNNAFFAGIEWDPNIDDKFCIDADAVGEGNQQKRAWEKWEDGTFHDMYTAWKSGTTYWDADLWIAAVIEPVATPVAPVSLSPANNSTSVSTSPTLTWNASTGATSYQLQVSANSGFTTTIFNQSNITGTSQQVTGLSNNTTYYWRVNASNTNGTSAWSSPVWSFTTQQTSLPDLTLVTPNGWSGPIVVSHVTGTTVDGAVDNKHDLYIDFAVKNNNEVAAINLTFYNALYIDGNEVQRWAVSPPVNPNEVVLIYDYNIGKLTAGTHTIKVVADVTNTILESNETNNMDTKTITLVGINDWLLNNIPDKYRLAQNYPNPFNPTTNIEYSIPEAGLVILKVYDLLGREISTLVNKEQQPGNYNITFDAKGIDSGIYIYTLNGGGKIFSKIMVLVK